MLVVTWHSTETARKIREVENYVTYGAAEYKFIKFIKSFC